MRSGTFLSLLLVLVLWSSCRSDFEALETTGRLEFSRDTVFLDTVFSNISTSTYSVKIYNRSTQDIFIPEVRLSGGEESLYRINVDGVPGPQHENVQILARDSIFIFIETTIASGEMESPEHLYVDHLEFRSKEHLQQIPLVTLVKDATFLFPSKDQEGFTEEIPIGIGSDGEPISVTGFYLKEEHLNLTKEKPYVIYGYAAVPPGKTLILQSGTKLHFHQNSGLIVSKDASLHVRGSLSQDTIKKENEVIFQGDRLENRYSKVPGQWGTIWLQKGSGQHFLENLTVKNAGLGILIEGEENDLTQVQMKNIQIYNSAISGLKAGNANITAENIVIGNSGQSSLKIIGGKYSFMHATISNYWQQTYREYPALLISNVGLEQTFTLDLEFHNSIIFGNLKQEIMYDFDLSKNVQFFFSHSLIKFGPAIEGDLYDFSNSTYYENISLNEEPHFAHPEENDFRPGPNSAAINLGNPEVAKDTPFDILGRPRTPDPDLGAYEYIESRE